MIDIKSLLTKIEGPSEDLRFAAWYELYASEDPIAEEELNRIFGWKDPVIKIVFARFLSQIHEEKAVKYLALLLEDESNDVFEATKIAFERNQYKNKLDVLHSLMHSKRKRAQFYTIEQLSSSRKFYILDTLLQMLDTDDEEVLFAILSALRHLPHRGIVPNILPFLRDKREEVRFRTLLIFDALNESYFLFSNKVFFDMLKDLSSRVRQAAIWSLRKRPSKSSINFFKELSINDADPMIRQESILALGSYHSSSVINHLLKILVTEKVVMVSLKAESVLLRMPHKKLASVLKRNLANPNQMIANKALFLLSEIKHNSTFTFNYIKKMLNQVKTDKEVIPFLESLGVLGSPKGIPLLESYLHDSPVVGYTAMLSLLKLYSETDMESFEKLLVDKELNSVIKQVILKHIIRYGSTLIFNEGIVNCLIKNLKEKNLQVRYLSSEALVHAAQFPITHSIFEALSSESDDTIIKRITDTLLSIFEKDSTLLTNLLKNHKDDAKKSALLLELIGQYTTTTTKPLKTIIALLQPPLNFLSSSNQEKSIDLIYSLITKHKITISDLLKYTKDSPDISMLLTLIVEKLNNVPSVHLPLPFHALGALLKQDDPAIQKAIVQLLGFNYEKESLTMLVNVLSDNKLMSLHKEASLSLNNIMEYRND